VGFGSYHWQVRCDGRRWFATVDDLHARRWDDSEHVAMARCRLTTALAATRWLSDAGLGFVVAPLPDTSGGVLRALGERYVLALYPFVEGRIRVGDANLAHEERAAVVRLLAALHAVNPSDCADVAADDFVLPNLNGLREAMADLDLPWDAGPFSEPTRELLARHAPALAAVLEQYLWLANSIVERGGGFVITHGEPHTGNTIGTDTGIVLIDWDTLLLAPPERDLWSLHDEDPDVLDVYRMLTGRVIDPDALHLYRLRWDLAEICLYVAQFRRSHQRSEDTTKAWDELRHSLDPTRW
jgi:aminoglycoside phosphotransferase (APT) family kinase protein